MHSSMTDSLTLVEQIELRQLLEQRELSISTQNYRVFILNPCTYPNGVCVGHI